MEDLKRFWEKRSPESPQKEWAKTPRQVSWVLRYSRFSKDSIDVKNIDYKKWLTLVNTIAEYIAPNRSPSTDGLGNCQKHFAGRGDSALKFDARESIEHMS